jgi:hypothetical protein
MGGPAASGVYPAKERVTDGARTCDLFSSATIRRCLFPGIAERCRIGLEKQISSLEVAHCFWVLRARWFQKCCQESVDYASPVPLQTTSTVRIVSARSMREVLVQEQAARWLNKRSAVFGPKRSSVLVPGISRRSSVAPHIGGFTILRRSARYAGTPAPPSAQRGRCRG